MSKSTQVGTTKTRHKKIGTAVEENLDDGEKSHGATFQGGPDRQDSPQIPTCFPGTGEQSTTQGRIGRLLDEIGEGLRADEKTNFEKLAIARKYGPMLLELKEIVVHGEFKKRTAKAIPEPQLFQVHPLDVHRKA